MTEGENNNLDNNNNTGQTQDNNYQQSGTFGIGHINGGEIQDGANVGGIIYDIDADIVNVIQQSSNSEQTPSQTLSSRENNEGDDQQDNSHSNLGRETFSDHKYNGELVLITLRFYDNSEVCRIQQIGIELDIAFGEVEEVFPYRNQFLQPPVESYIRFGIKHGKLCLELNNGVIPLNQRRLNSDPQGVWQVRTTGIETNPVWEFEAQGQPAVLGGSRCDENLGLVNLSEDRYCVVQASFKVGINNNDLEITAQDGAWSENDQPQVIATKRSLFFKRFVKPKLQDYLSRVVLEYDSAINF